MAKTQWQAKQTSTGLQALQPLIGERETTMYNCWFLESMDAQVTGWASFERLDDSFVIWRDGELDKAPAGTWVIGYSDPQDKYEAFYHDVRGVARIFEAIFDGETLTFWREDKDMHQRVTIRLAGETLELTSKASDDQGKSWRKDFDMTFAKKIMRKGNYDYNCTKENL